MYAYHYIFFFVQDVYSPGYVSNLFAKYGSSARNRERSVHVHATRMMTAVWDHAAATGFPKKGARFSKIEKYS